MKLLSILLMIISVDLHSKDIFYGDDNVYIPVSSEGVHLFFDIPIVSTSNFSYFVINQAENKNVTKKDYRAIFIKWSGGSKEEKISFMLSNRKRVHLVFKYIENSGLMKLHDSYTLIKQKMYKNDDLEKRPLKLQAIALLKAVKKREFVKGYTSNRANIELKDGFKKIRTTLKGVYAGRFLNGFLVEVRNNLDIPVLINHSEIKVGRPDLAIISYLKKKRLRSKESTYIVVVTKKPARHKDIFISYYPILGEK